MKRFLLIFWAIFFGLLSLLWPSFRAGASSQRGSHPRPIRPLSGSPMRQVQNYGQLPLAFEPNQGQSDPQVQYLARGGGYNLFITSQEAVLVLESPRTALPPKFQLKGTKGLSPGTGLPGSPGTTPPTVLRMKLEGARTGGVFESLKELPGTSNYFIGKDRSKWRRNIPQFGKIQTSDIYPGIDLVYYGNQGKLEYDFVVKPGADPQSVHLKYEGAKAARVNAQGDLELETNQGTLHFRSPTLYQENQGQKNSVEGRYRLEEGGKVGFEVKEYDRSRPLIIDPVLDYSTFWGGVAYDQGYAIALDPAGNAYFTGFTRSANFPTVNPLQGGLGVGAGGTAFQNAFVAKINPAGTAMVYSTYLGGSYYDQGNAIAVDSSGDAYVAGFTYAPDFPVQNAIQPFFGASGVYTLYTTINSFVTELDPSGSGLVYSTYWGGSGRDFAAGLALDSGGNAYVTGNTQSPDFPTFNPIQAALAGTQNGFVYKIGPSGGSIVYSTYLGGSGTDGGDGIAVDTPGNAYVAGYTASSNFPILNPFQATLKGPQNAFITEVNAAGNALVYSTYLGGSGHVSGATTIGDAAYSVAVDNGSNAYVTGYTGSPDFPIQNPGQASLVSPYENAFVT
jgi:hypothetical protein